MCMCCHLNFVPIFPNFVFLFSLRSEWENSNSTTIWPMAKRKAQTEKDTREKPKRKHSTQWDQEHTERLCSLILEHGQSGILNKTTNMPTNERKKAEWQLIHSYFNAHESVFNFLHFCFFFFNIFRLDC